MGATVGTGGSFRQKDGGHTQWTWFLEMASLLVGLGSGVSLVTVARLIVVPVMGPILAQMSNWRVPPAGMSPRGHLRTSGLVEARVQLPLLDWCFIMKGRVSSGAHPVGVEGPCEFPRGQRRLCTTYP